MRYDVLKRSDNRLDLGPAGRSLFVSQEKEAQNRSARRVRAWMRLVLILMLIGLAVVAAILFAAYFIPWFHSEITLDDPAASSDVSGPVSSLAEEEVLVQLDELGLPIYSDEICLFVIDPFSPAPEDWQVTLESAEGVQVDARIAPAISALSAAAREAGLALTFTEGYVSEDEQRARFEREVQRLMKEENLTVVMARAQAAATVPEPGESDFETGLCLRLAGDAATFPESRTCSWLKANMGKYGFTFRYPEGKEEATGVTGDLRVIRYVGAQNAAAMQQRSMCLEEYITYLDSQ